MNAIPRQLLLGLLVLGAAFTAAPAQTAPGTIAGRIYNPATGEYVRSALVRVLSTNSVVTSESGGYYRLTGVPAGEATVEVSFMGYATIAAKVAVRSGETTTRDFDLVAADTAIGGAGETVRLDKFVVSTDREGSAKAIMEQRHSMNITQTIASDVFGDNAEGNVGDFLRFVPGVWLFTSLGEVRNVGLGGLGTEYTSVTVDGVSMAAADANNSSGTGINTRAPSFEMFSLSSMDALEVSRTISADVDANAPGGTINLRSKRAFDRKGRRVTLQANVTGHSSAITPHKSLGPDDQEKTLKLRPGGIFEYSDAFLDNRLGLMLAVSESNIYQEADRITATYNRTTSAADRRLQVPTSLAFMQSPRFNKRFAATLTTDYKATSRLVLSLTTIYNYSELWNPQRSVTLNAGTRASVIGETPEFSFTTDSTSAGLVSNPVAYAKMGETITVTPKFEYKLNNLTVEGVASFSDSTSWYETEARRGTIWQCASPTARGNFHAERSLDSLSTDWKVTQISGGDIASGASFSMPSIITNDERFARGTFLTGQLTATLVTHGILPVVWKAGLKVRSEDRNFENRYAMNRWKFNGPAGNVTSWADYRSAYEFTLGETGTSIKSLSGEGVFMPDLAAIGRLFRDHPEYFTYTATASDYYNSNVVNRIKFSEDVDGGFVMGTATLGRATIRAGVRREETATDVLECDPRSSEEVRAAGHAINSSTGVATTIAGIDYQFLSRPRVHRRNNYSNNFPSASFKYGFARDLDVHLGFSSTIRRPSYGDVAGVWVINDTTDRVTAPNVRLRPETARNYAARLAYYFKGIGQVSVAVFQNDVKSLIVASEMSAAEFGYTGEEYRNYTFVSNSNSPSRVKMRSLEVAYSQNLGLLGPLFRRLTVRTNYTRTYADIIKPTLAPHGVNAGADYTYKRFNVYANVNWSDTFPTTNTGRTYRRHRTQVDAGAGWKLSPNLALTLSVRDLFAAPHYTIEHVAPSAPFLSSYLEVGTYYTLALKATF